VRPSESADRHHLQRFLDAQQSVYAQVLSELQAGEKRTHWMWFVFPQLQGLGHSAMAQRYAISSLAEATAYRNHPVLGARLRECTRLVNQVAGRAVHEIFGSPDDFKFRSSMTLFTRATPDNAEFVAALAKYFGGQEDRGTVEILDR
jgi:uncharacterized protein (DUF1810 family)